MRKFLYIVLAITFVISVSGCTASQKSFDEYLQILENYSQDSKDEIDGALDAVEDGLARVTSLITEAEKGEAPTAGEGDPIVDLTKQGAGAAAPFLPFPFNVLIGLVPFGVAWLRAKNRADKRTAEEALLIAGLQTLKKNDRESFDKFIEYRDLATKGLLTAKQTAELLEGISSIRAKFSS